MCQRVRVECVTLCEPVQVEKKQIAFRVSMTNQMSRYILRMVAYVLPRAETSGLGVLMFYFGEHEVYVRWMSDSTLF